MKKATIYILIATAILACDPCRNETCQNDQPCIDGTCECSTWYEGESCEIYSLEQYEGFYDGQWGCLDTTDQASIRVQTTEDPGRLYFIDYSNGLGYHGEFDPDSDQSFTIPLQTAGAYQISGSGSFGNDQLKLTILLASEAGNLNCQFWQ